jgi:hypothetical protein
VWLGRVSRRAGCWEELRGDLGDRRLKKEASLPWLFCIQMPGGPALSPGLLPTSCHKAGEDLLCIIRGAASPRHMVSRPPSPEHHRKCLLLTPALVQPLLPLEHWTISSGPLPWPSALDAKVLHIVKAGLSFFVALTDRGEGGIKGRDGADGPAKMRGLGLQPSE